MHDLSKRKHRVRRSGIAVSSNSYIVLFLVGLIPVNVTGRIFFCFITSDNRGLGDIVGLFIITTVSNFVNFLTGSKLPEEIKATGH